MANQVIADLLMASVLSSCQRVGVPLFIPYLSPRVVITSDFMYGLWLNYKFSRSSIAVFNLCFFVFSTYNNNFQSVLLLFEVD